MNQPADYTHLESLFLFQSLLHHGVDKEAFARISEQLRNNALIKEAESYDPSRLSPDALRQLFLRLFGEELKSDGDKADNVDGVGSPGSRKRKVGTPPLPTLKEVYENVEKIPILVDRLYARYRDHIEKQIREDEARFDQVQKEIQLLERTERERRAARAASQNGTPVLAPRESKAAVAPNRPSPTPTPTPVATPLTTIKRGPIPHTPVLPPKPAIPHVSVPSIAPPSHLPPGATAIRPTPSPKPPNGASSVLQAPAGVPQTTPRPLHPPTQPPKQVLSPRPEVIKPKDGSAPPQSATPAGGSLKWEKPYQPPQATQTIPPRQFQSPVQQTVQPVGQQHLQQQPQQQHLQQHPQVTNQQQQHLTLQQQQQQQQWYAQQQQQQQQNAHLTPQQIPGQPGQSKPQQPQGQYPQHVQRPQLPHNQQQAQQHTQQQHLPHAQHPHPPQHLQPQYPQHVQHAQQAQRIQQAQKAQSPTLPKAPHTPQPQRAQQPVQHPQHRQQGKPVLVPPQAGQLAPPLQPAPLRRADATGVQTGVQPPHPRPTSTTPVHPPIRPVQAPLSQAQQAQQVQQAQHAQHVPRPIASASPTTPANAAGPIAPPQQRWPQTYPQQQLQGQQRGSASLSPAPAAVPKDKNFASPYVNKAPRPAIPEHVMRAAQSTPNRRISIATAPQTPVSGPVLLTHGFGTRWTSNSTPSTPRPLSAEPESPAFEAVSPPQRPATLPDSTPKPLPKKQAPKSTLKVEGGVSKPLRGRAARSQKGRAISSTPSLTRARRSQSILSQTEESSIEQPELAAIIKHEEATPKPAEDTGDTTADESVPGRPQIETPGSVSSRLQKRKRQDTPAEIPPPSTHVLWTRGFTKVSSSALDQISSHRDANMFATALREKDAPNYRQIVLQPQDITSIRSAIKHGNKAAVHASQSLPGGDPGTAHVWLPVSKELVPPKGIINSAQLERELVHMFCNAIMYNADPDRGPGEGFIKRDEDEEEEVVGYKLDENGVVKNTRSMFVEVEKLLGDLRSAEKERSAPPPSVARPASVATPVDDTPGEGDDDAGDGESGFGTVKRRRIARG